MSLGNYAAGLFPAGADPVAPLSPRPVNRTPDAPILDPKTRRHRIDSDGNFEGQHPVDHEVQMVCFVATGSMPSTDYIGNSILEIVGIVEEDGKHAHEVEERLREGLADLLSRRAIEIVGIKVEVNVQGRTEYELRYHNLVKGLRDQLIKQADDE